MTPNRPLATCLMALRRTGSYSRSGSSPPSPVLERPPSRFIATASTSWASGEIEPSDIAPVLKRVTIELTGSTSSTSIGGRSPSRSANSPRSVPASRRQVVDLARVLLEQLVLLAAGGVLQREDRLRVEQVHLALAAPLVLAADLERAVGALGRVGGVRAAVPGGGLLGDDLEPDAAEPARRAGEVLVDEVLRQAERLEDLRAGVGGDGADAHLAHHLEHALAQALDVVAQGGVERGAGQLAAHDEVLDRLEGEVGVDRGGAVADEQRDVVDLAGVAGLHDEADAGAGLLADEVVVHRGGEQQRRDRRHVLGGVAVGQHDDPGARRDRAGHLAAHPVERVAQRLAAAVHGVEAVHLDGGQARPVAVRVDVDDLGELVVVEHRERQHDLPAAGGGRLEQVLLRADAAEQAGDELLADGVERRVGDLREQLAEVVEQLARPLGQHGDRRVGAHRADRLERR